MKRSMLATGGQVTAHAAAMAVSLLLLFSSLAYAQGKPPEVERITLRPRGFEPSEIQRPPGRFLLVVDNRSYVRNITLRLDTEAGPPVTEARLSLAKLKWRQFITLPPGRYVLSEVGHPKWMCRITISPH